MAGAPQANSQTAPPQNQSLTQNQSGAPDGGGFVLPPELAKEYPGLSKFKDVAGLAKSYGELEKFARSSLRVPAPGATDEERSAFYSKLGRPESAEKYELKFPEGITTDEKLTESFKGVAHEMGLTQAQAQGLAQWFAGQSQGVMDAQSAQREVQLQEGQKELDKEWGWQKDRNTALAGRALALMLDGNAEHPLVKVLDETGLGNHPAVIKFFYEQAIKQGEDKLIVDDSGPTLDDRQTAQERINEIRANPDHPYHKRGAPGHKEAVTEMQRLYDVLYAKEE